MNISEWSAYSDQYYLEFNCKIYLPKYAAKTDVHWITFSFALKKDCVLIRQKYKRNWETTFTQNFLIYSKLFYQFESIIRHRLNGWLSSSTPWKNFSSRLFRALFERNELAKLKWSGVIVSFYLLFALSMFLFYSLVTVVMQRTSALMFNLSVLSSDFYSLLFGLFLFKIKVRKLLHLTP